MFANTKFRHVEHKIPLYTQQLFWYSVNAAKLILHFITNQGGIMRCLNLDKTQTVTSIDASSHSPILNGFN